MSTCAAIVTAQKQALSAEAELEVRRLEAQWKTLEYVVADAEEFLRSRITFHRTCPGSNGFYLEPKEVP